MEEVDILGNYSSSLTILYCFFHFLRRITPLMKSDFLIICWISVTLISLQYKDPEAISFFASPLDSVNHA